MQAATGPHQRDALLGASREGVLVLYRMLQACRPVEDSADVWAGQLSHHMLPQRCRLAGGLSAGDTVLWGRTAELCRRCTQQAQGASQRSG